MKEINSNKLSSLIQKLTEFDGISSDEYNVSLCVSKMLEKYCDTCSVDEFGNVFGRIKKDDDAKTLLFEAHIDRIGLMVSQIDENGLLKFTNIGGVDERILPACEVCVLGKEPIHGVIFASKKTADRNPSVDELRIDTFMTKEMLKKKVSIGDMILITSKYINLKNGQISSGAMDNRAGVAAILDALSKIDRNKIKYNINVLFSTQEELGLHGAYIGAFSTQCDVAIVVDVTHGSTPDSKKETGVFPIGCGAVICRGPNFHYDYSKQLIEMSEKFNIPYAVEVASGPSGTSAWALQIAAGGIPSTLVSIPLKYMHTNVEALDIKDVEAVSALLALTAEGGIYLD